MKIKHHNSEWPPSNDKDIKDLFEKLDKITKDNERAVAFLLLDIFLREENADLIEIKNQCNNEFNITKQLYHPFKKQIPQLYERFGIEDITKATNIYSYFNFWINELLIKHKNKLKINNIESNDINKKIL